MAKKRENIQLSKEDIERIRAAAEYGVKAFLEQNPRFQPIQRYILQHIDTGKLYDHLKEFEKQADAKRGWSDRMRANFVLSKLAEYVSRGDAFDEQAGEAILNKSLEAKTGSWWGGRKASERLGEEDYFKQALDTFGHLYQEIVNGKAQGEKAEAAKEAYERLGQFNLTDPAVRVLKYHHVPERDIETFRNALRKRGKKDVEVLEEAQKAYEEPHKIASAILGLGGLGLVIVSGLKMTGNAVALSGESPVGVIAGVLLVIGSLLLWRKRRGGRSKSVRVIRGKRKRKRRR